jgi:hypothetical protein
MPRVGGGSLMTPLPILLFGVHPATAVGSDLRYAAPAKRALIRAEALVQPAFISQSLHCKLHSIRRCVCKTRA